MLREQGNICKWHTSSQQQPKTPKVLIHLNNIKWRQSKFSFYKWLKWWRILLNMLSTCWIIISLFNTHNTHKWELVSFKLPGLLPVICGPLNMCSNISPTGPAREVPLGLSQVATEKNCLKGWALFQGGCPTPVIILFCQMHSVQ